MEGQIAHVIRCAELKIMAAIGCGEQLLEQLKNVIK